VFSNKKTFGVVGYHPQNVKGFLLFASVPDVCEFFKIKRLAKRQNISRGSRLQIFNLKSQAITTKLKR
jgi:hypothetical protein